MRGRLCRPGGRGQAVQAWRQGGEMGQAGECRAVREWAWSYRQGSAGQGRAGSAHTMPY